MGAAVRVATAVVMLTCLAHAGSTEQAKVHFERGTIYYDLGKYLEAAKEYETAFELAPRATLLFNIGQAYRLGGKPDRALAAYRGFLRRSAGEPVGSSATALRVEAEGHVAALERIVEPGTAGPPVARATPAPAPPRSPAPNLPPITDRRVTWIDVRGDAANEDKLQRCRALAERQGWELWGGAPIQAAIYLSSIGNRVDILVFRQLHTSQALSQSRMEDLCNEVLRAIAATIAAKAVQPEISTAPPGEADLRTALTAKRRILDGCRNAYARDTTQVAVEVTVVQSGAVTAVALPSVDLGGRFGNCLERALKTLRLSTYKGDQVVLRSTWGFSAPPANAGDE